ncbi:MAG: PhoH family protein [Candidatus Cloacimonetes bacterium]|nr:PhoH family protein [Candidatus Cloacimonadota bacterium]
MKEKIFVLDTNVLIHNPKALFAFDEHRVVIPITVIEEIDMFKKGVDEKGRNARQIGRFLDQLREKGSLKNGVETETGGTIQVAMSRKITDTTSDILIIDTNDNLIIGTAMYFQNKYPESKVVMVSKDANVRIKADAVGLVAQNFESDKVKFDELFTGYSEMKATKRRWDSLNNSGSVKLRDVDFFPNEFVDVSYKDEVITTRWHCPGKTLKPLEIYKGQDVFGISARNKEQELALDLLLDDSVRLVSLVGIAGTGKTLLAMAAGLNQVVEENKYTRLVISRPIFPLGKDLGFLPGSKEEKFNPWMQPIYDNMEILIYGHNEKADNGNGKVFGKKRPSLDEYLEYGFIELEPLTYIRGRSLPNQFIIIDEAQNLTPHEMKTIITRAGEGTKIVLTGDPYQIDIPYLDSESNGLSMAVEKLKQEAIIGHITLTKGERSLLADIAAKYF